MSYNQIRRGPVTTAHFTMCHNLMFRSAGFLTPAEVVVLGNVLSHQQYWETSAEQIGAQVGLHASTVRRALVGLAAKHFVVWGQERNPDGTMGTGWYFVTDIPLQLRHDGITDGEAVASAVTEALTAWLSENPRSAPGYHIANPVDEPPTSPVDNSGSSPPQADEPPPDVPAGQNRDSKNRSAVEPVSGESGDKENHPRSGHQLENTSLAAAGSLREPLPTGEPTTVDQVVTTELGLVSNPLHARAREALPPVPATKPEDYPLPTKEDRALYGPRIHQGCTHCGSPAGRLCVRASRKRPLPVAPKPHEQGRPATAVITGDADSVLRNDGGIGHTDLVHARSG